MRRSARWWPPDCRQASFTSSDFCRRRPARGERGWKNWPPRCRGARPRARWFFTRRRTGFWRRWRIWNPSGDPSLRVVVARELTKIHEEFLRGTVAEARRELAARDRIRGEITLLVEARRQSSGAELRQPHPRRLPTALRASRPKPAKPMDEKEALKRIGARAGPVQERGLSRVATGTRAAVVRFTLFSVPYSLFPALSFPRSLRSTAQVAPACGCSCPGSECRQCAGREWPG